MSQHDALTLRDALRNIQYEAASLADAQVIALQALNATYPARAAISATQPAQAAQPDAASEAFQAMADGVPVDAGWVKAQAAQSEPKRCEYCDDTGDVTSIDGEWRGYCTCHLGKTLQAVPVMAKQQAAQGAVEVVGVEYFAYSNEIGFETYTTSGEALSCARDLLNLERKEAIYDNEWGDEVASICWGVVIGKTRAVPNVPEDGEPETCDYVLTQAPTQPAAGADTSNASLKVTRTLIAANKANAILRLALKELRAALDPDDWMGELPMQTFVDHILKQAVQGASALVLYRREIGEGDWAPCTPEQYAEACGNPHWDTKTDSVGQPAVAQGASEVFTALADHCPVDNGRFNGRAAQGDPVRHVGDSKFESWYQAHPKAIGGDKQLARDAYAAGMSDPVAQGAGEVVERVIYTPVVNVNSNDEKDGRHPNDKEPHDPEMGRYLDLRGDDEGQGIHSYWKWGYRAGWNDRKRHTNTQPAAGADARDAERYRWLRDQANTSVNIDIGAGCEISDTLDAAIDAQL